MNKIKIKTRIYCFVQTFKFLKFDMKHNWSYSFSTAYAVAKSPYVQSTCQNCEENKLVCECIPF